MPIELLQFGGLVAVILAAALLWFVFVYRARRTGEGDGTPAAQDEPASPGDPATHEKRTDDSGMPGDEKD